MVRFRAFVMMVCLLAAPAWAADARLEKGVAVPDTVPAAVKAQLSATGVRVINESGAAYAEVWLGKAVAAEAKPPNADITYAGISDGTFLGVWRYVAQGLDYRGHPVLAGLYSMRYALMPLDANHLGSFPYRDFILLVPLDADQNPQVTLKWEEVVALSKKAAPGASHPAILPMVPAEGAGEATLVKNDQGQYLLRTAVSLKSGASLPIQFVVIGHGE